jgi:hypothetical protein
MEGDTKVFNLEQIQAFMATPEAKAEITIFQFNIDKFPDWQRWLHAQDFRGWRITRITTPVSSSTG